MKYPSSLKQLLPIISSVIFVFLVSGVAYAAWSDPACAPTGCNAPTPINVSATAQNKEGFLGLGVASPERRLHVNGSIGISNANFLDLGLGLKANITGVNIGRVGYTNTSVSTPARPALQLFGGLTTATDSRRLVEVFDDLNVFGTINTCTGSGSCSPITGGGDGLWTKNSSGTAIFPKVLTQMVGVGTNSPYGDLHVKDANNSGQASILIQSELAKPSKILFKSDNTDAYSLNRPANSNDLVFTANSVGAPVLTLKNNGFVGIGTSPTAKFHVRTGTGVNDAGVNFKLYSTANSNKLLIDAKNNAGQKIPLNIEADPLAINGSVGIGTYTPTSFKLEVAGNVGPSADNQYDLGSATRRWRNLFAVNIYGDNICTIDGVCTAINSLNSGDKWASSTANQNNIYNKVLAGNVGVGTLNPTSKLHVVGETRVDGKLATFGTLFSSGQIIGENSAPSLLLNQTDQTDKNVRINVQDGIFRISRVTSPTSGNLGNTIISSPFVINLDNGNVGVGTGDPSTKLHVAGTLGVDRVGTTGNEYGRLKFGAFNLEGKDVGYIAYKSTSPQSLDVFGGVVVAEGVPMQPRLIRLFDDVNIAGKLTVNRICTTGGVCFDTSSLSGGWTAGPSGSIYRQQGTVAIGTANPNTNSSVSLQTFRTRYNNMIIEAGDDSANTDEQAQIMFKTPNKSWNISARNDGVLRFFGNGDTRLALKDDGNIGIGTTNPQSKLDVRGNTDLVGNVAIGGTVKILGGSPGAGKVLTSDAEGNASWQTSGGISILTARFKVQDTNSGAGVNFNPVRIEGDSGITARKVNRQGVDRLVMTCPASYRAIAGGGLCKGLINLNGNTRDGAVGEWYVGCGNQFNDIDEATITCVK